MEHLLSRENCRPKKGYRFVVKNEEYEIGNEIGDGAVGVVRKVRRSKDGIERALKFLAPDPKYIDKSVFDDVAIRFRREGERAQHLDHPSLVKVYSYEENKDGSAFKNGAVKNPFILMQFIKGRTLESYIKNLSKQMGEKIQETFTLDAKRLEIGVQISSALEFLHSRKLVHRDVKPANIFLLNDIGSSRVEALLGDFGIMKWGDYQASVSSGTLTVTAQEGLGTLKYMSPEQAIRPKDVTVKSDIFSFGVTLFELFSKRILASPHHVTETMLARLFRGTTMGRFNEMGYRITTEDERIGELVLDMHLRGAQGRPSIEKVRGRLTWELEQRRENET